MSLFSKRLMKWREPSIRMLTGKNILIIFISFFVIAVPITFLCGKFSWETYLFSVAYLSIAGVFLALQSFFKQGAQIQLREDSIVRPGSRFNHKSAYEDIDRVYFYRNCSASLVNDMIVINAGERSIEGQNFTRFEIKMKSEGVFSKPVTFFCVPDGVNVDQVLQILRDKGVNVIEGELPS